MLDGSEEFVVFLSKIDFDEVFFIPIPEEIVEFLDEVPDFPGDLNFFLIFHFFLPLSLPFDPIVFGLFGSEARHGGRSRFGVLPCSLGGDP